MFCMATPAIVFDVIVDILKTTEHTFTLFLCLIGYINKAICSAAGRSFIG